MHGMRKKAYLRLAAAGLLLFAVSGAAVAQSGFDLQGNVELTGGRPNISVTDACLISCPTIDGSRATVAADFDLRFSTAWSVGIELRHIRSRLMLSEDDVTVITVDADATRWNVEPRYAFANGVFVGGYVQDFTLGASYPEFDESFSQGFLSVGAFLGWDAGRYGVQINGGRSDFSNWFNDAETPSLDERHIGISGNFRPADGWEVFGAYNRSNLSFEGETQYTDIAAIGFEYFDDDGWGVFGAATSNNMDEFYDMRQANLGVGFNLREITGTLPGMVTVDWRRGEWLSAREDVFSIGWSVAFGGGRPRSQNCVISNARGQNRAAIATLYDCGIWAEL